MNKLQNRIRLLSLLSIFFIYRFIYEFFIENDSLVAIMWLLFAVVYLISLIILYFVAQRWQKELNQIE
jgi:hypothetical protein